MIPPELAQTRFFKLEALANDFVLVDGRSTSFAPSPPDVVRLADRRTGIGFDQLLVLRPGSGDLLAEVDIFNADGSRAEQCGNGMRAIAAWLNRAGALSPETRLGTPAGQVELARHPGGGYVAVLPGPRALEPEALGLGPPPLPADIADWTLVSLGNAHLIATVSAPPSAADLARVAASLDASPWRERVNIGLMHVDSDEAVTLRVHERGAGPTLACGSAACAAAWALRRRLPAASPVAIEQSGGRLVVDLASRMDRAITIGPASVVYEGTIA